MNPVIAPGTPVPEFTLKREDGSDFTREDLAGRTTVFVFYPNAFSPVCSDQFQVYEEVLDDFRTAADPPATLFGVSTDHSASQTAFKNALGTTIEMLSDFEPKGETARKFGAYFPPAGFTNRALVVIGPDQVVKWSYLADNPGVLPGANLIFDGLRAAHA